MATRGVPVGTEAATEWVGLPGAVGEHATMTSDMALCKECSQWCRKGALCDCCVRSTGKEPTVLPNWEGVEGSRDSHRTLGGRAWCGECSTYCYRHLDRHCDCCLVADGFVPVWIPGREGDRRSALMTWLLDDESVSTVTPEDATALVERLVTYGQEGLGDGW